MSKNLRKSMRTQVEGTQSEEKLMLERWIALTDLLHQNHRKTGGAGGAMVCICGCGCGGTEACSMVAIMRDFIRYVPKGNLTPEWQAHAERILRAIGR